MKKAVYAIFIFIFVVMAVSACGADIGGETEYMSITAQEAKAIMDTESDYVILDVRTEEEFVQGHIPGAILIPDFDIREKAEALLTDKNQMLLVYCRSGRRSKTASETLAELGYTNVKEFGGIIDWPYAVEK